MNKFNFTCLILPVQNNLETFVSYSLKSNLLSYCEMYISESV